MISAGHAFGPHLLEALCQLSSVSDHPMLVLWAPLPPARIPSRPSPESWWILAISLQVHSPRCSYLSLLQPPVHSTSNGSELLVMLAALVSYLPPAVLWGGWCFVL